MSWQPSLFTPSTKWIPPAGYPTLHGVVALDLECYDPLLKTHGPGWCFKQGFVCGIALAGEDWANYWPIRHYEGNLPEKHVLAWLKQQLDNPELTLLVYNAGYDLGWLRRCGIRPRAKVIDVAIAVPLIDENRFSYGLDDVCKDWLSITKDYGLLMETARKGLSLGRQAKKETVMGSMDRLPAWAVAEYAIQDVRLTRRLWFERCVSKIEEEDLPSILALEHELIPISLDMREFGVRVDVDRAEQLSRKYRQATEDLLGKIRQLTGRTLNLWEAADVDKAFKAVGIDWHETTAKGDKSFRSTAMEQLDHPLAQLVVKARRLDKAEGTFIKGHVLGHQVSGRIHAVFSPLRSEEGGAVTGRYSSSNPNLQNLPSREEEIASDIRGLFLPEEGEEWASSDFSSQEPRMCVHFAHAAGVPGVAPFVAAYRENPDLDFHQKGADITGLKRKQAKNLTLGKMYGMGGVKLCRSLGLPTQMTERINRRTGLTEVVEVAGPEGQYMMDQYDRYMPFVRALSELCVRKAETRKWIRTLLGRRRHFTGQERVAGERGAFPYKALNCLIQGSSADMTKKAMVDLYKAGARLLVTVHDEVGMSCSSRRQAIEFQDIMTKCVQLHVPVTADLEVGLDWGHLEKLA